MARAKENNYVLPQARAMEFYIKYGRGLFVKKDTRMTFISPDAISLYGIPNDKFLLDESKFVKGFNIGTDFPQKGIRPVAEGGIIDEGSRILRVFEFSNGETVHINERYYKDFQKVYAEWFQNHEISCYSQGPNAPVCFVRRADFIGFIPPVRQC